MAVQQTIGVPVSARGAGLHTNRRCRVTLRPAPVGHGRKVMMAGQAGEAVALSWAHRVASTMSTTVALPSGATIRTIEHLMAALAAYAVDNVLVEVDGPEIPIFDGSAAPWCRLLDAAGVVGQGAPRRVLEVLKPVQIQRHAGFLRIDPDAAFSVDMTYDLVPDFPIMRWAGTPDRRRFVDALARSRSFGTINWRKRLGRPPGPRRPFDGAMPVERHKPDPALPAEMNRGLIQRLEQAIAARDPAEPVLRGVRPGRAALVVGRMVLPWPRYRDEPVRHAALDMIGDLALADIALKGRVTAHNPSHEKTYLLVAALMEDPSAWRVATEDEPAASLPFSDPPPMSR